MRMRAIAYFVKRLSGDPIPVVLHCPVCHKQHIDEVCETTNPGWLNPPHTSHKCLECGTVWRPCPFPTEGVASISIRGHADTWPDTK